MQMRQELLAHLTELHQQELVKLDDSTKAAASAIARFGDPAGLARELQAGVSLWQRLGVRFDSWWRRRDGEPVLKFASRIAFGATFAMGLYMGTALGVAWWVRPDQQTFSFFAAFFIAMLAATATGGFVFALLGQVFRRIVQGRIDGRAVLRGLAVSAICGPVAFFMAGGVAASMAGDLDYMFDEFPMLYALLLFAPAMLMGVSVIAEYERRRSAPWDELSLDGD